MMKSLTRVNLSFIRAAGHSSRRCDGYMSRAGRGTRGQRVVYIVTGA